MDKISSYRKRVYKTGESMYDEAMLQLTIDMPICEREKQHLIEEKIDKIFDEVGQIFSVNNELSEGDHTA